MLPWSRAKRCKILPTVQGCDEEAFGEPFDCDCGKPPHSLAVKNTQWSAASDPTRKCAGGGEEGTEKICAENKNPNQSSATKKTPPTARPLPGRDQSMPLLCFPHPTQAILEKMYMSGNSY